MPKRLQKARSRDQSRELDFLTAGRQAYRQQEWADAFDFLCQADSASPLRPSDLECLARAAGLIGRDEEFLKLLERLFELYAGARRNLPAARAAFWLAMRLLMQGEAGQAGGWLGRAERLVGNRKCAEQGYLLLPRVYRLLAAGKIDEALKTAKRAVAVGCRFSDGDLVALGQNLCGRALMRKGEISAALAVLDEVMLSAAPDRVSPMITGIVYCNVIEACQQVFALERSREWTAMLAAWCARQPQLVTFAGLCHVHRAEIMQISGDWEDAVAEARRASARSSKPREADAVGPAYYQEGEVHRMRGDFAAAERAYRKASQLGHEPQPGLALLRLAAGRPEAATAAIRRSVVAARGRLERARLLPAYVEIMLAVGSTVDAEVAYNELKDIAADFDSKPFDAIVTHASGAIHVAKGRHASAVAPLREAFEVWNRFGAPYLAARIRVAMGVAYRKMGDNDGAALEFEAARAVFARLGAKPDLDRVMSLAGNGAGGAPGGLTRREVEVIQLVAAGMTNRAIAGELGISERTVDRHVSNMLMKLGIKSRAAATAFAYEHGLR